MLATRGFSPAICHDVFLAYAYQGSDTNQGVRSIIESLDVTA
jgi:hypothetical protein